MKLIEFMKQFQYRNDGIGKNTSIFEVDEKQLLVGIAVELEHTSDLNKSASIAIDHLTENDNYYTILIKSGLVDEENAIKLGEKYLNYDNQSNSSNYEDKPHESGAYLQDGMAGDKDRNGHPIPAIDPDFSKMFNYDDDLTDTLLGFESKNVNEIVGADGATSAVGDANVNNQNKYDEYMKKDFNSLTDDEKDEFFEIWKERKKQNQ